MGAGRAIKAQQSKSDSKQTRRVARSSSDRGTTSNTKVATKAVKPQAKEERKRVPPPPVADPILEVESKDVPSQQLPVIESSEIKSDVVNAITWDDPQLDRRIIEGMLTDRNALIDELSVKGISSAAVVRRAADLGLSEAYLRHVQTVAADLAGDRPGARRVPSSLAARDCLSCNRVFLSSGPGNRICPRCRGADAGLAQL